MLNWWIYTLNTNTFKNPYQSGQHGLPNTATSGGKNWWIYTLIPTHVRTHTRADNMDSPIQRYLGGKPTLILWPPTFRGVFPFTLPIKSVQKLVISHQAYRKEDAKKNQKFMLWRCINKRKWTIGLYISCSKEPDKNFMFPP